MKTAERQLHPTIAAAVPAMIDLCKKYGVKKLEIFGSAVRSDFDIQKSDLDLLADFGQPDDTYAERYLQFADDLEALIGKKVDILTEYSLKNPYLKAIIYAEKIHVFAA